MPFRGPSAAPFSARPTSGIAPAPQLTFLDKAFVIAHDELRFDLLHGIHRHAHDNQKRGTAEIKRNVQPLKHETPHMVVKPYAQSSGKVMQVNTSNHPFREEANRGKVNPAHEGQTAQN